MMNVLIRLYICLALLSCIGFPFQSSVSAQQANGLDVTLLDPSRFPVIDASVTLRGVAPDALQQTVTSASNGHYRFQAPAGEYRLIVTDPPFRKIERAVTLASGSPSALQITLELEPLSQDVLVSAAALPVEATAASESASVVTVDDLRRKQFTFVADVLRQQPGMTLAQADAGGGTTSLFLGGGVSNFARVVVDGVPLNQPGGAIDFSAFTLDNIDKIEVVRGAQSALSGSDAMTGTVEILTHRGSTRVPQLQLEGEGGAFSTGRGMARLSGLAGAMDYSAAAGYFGTRGHAPNDRFLNRTLSGNLGFQLGDRNSLRLTLRNNTSDAGAPGQTAFTPPNLDQHNAQQNFAAGMAWETWTGRSWQHRLTATETYIRQDFENPLSDFFTSPDPFGSCALPRSAQAVPSAYCDFPYSSHNRFNRAGFGWQTSYVAARGTLTAGYAYQVENGFLGALGGGHARRNNQAGFVDGRWQLLRRISINAGFRVEDNDNFGTKVVPRAGVAVTARTGGSTFGPTRLRFSYGQGVKEPRLDQSFGTDICNPGNPTLSPERSHTIYTGVEQRFASDRVRLTSDYFDSRFYDIVSFTFCFPGGPCPVTAPTGCPFGFGTYFNTDLARARGVTTVAEARIFRRISLVGNYTFNDTRVLQSPNAFDPALSSGNRLIRQPVHAGTISLNADMGRFIGAFTARFAGRRTDSDFLFPPLGLTSNPGYATFGVAGSFRIDRRATAFARIENLSGEHYQEILGYSALGRAAYGGMRFTFGGE